MDGWCQKLFYRNILSVSVAAVSSPLGLVYTGRREALALGQNLVAWEDRRRLAGADAALCAESQPPLPSFDGHTDHISSLANSRACASHLPDPADKCLQD